MVDPSESAVAQRGTSSDAFVEAIDLIPTFIERLGGDPNPVSYTHLTLPTKA